MKRRSAARTLYRWNPWRLAVNVVVLTVVCLVAVGFGFQARTASADSVRARHYQQVTVAVGDTLWDIAGRLPVKGDRRDVVERIRQLNGLGVRPIYAGEVLRVPLD